MKLYVNGDSNSAGHGTTWVKKLGNYFNFEIENHALGGGSNPRILRTTFDFLNQKKSCIQDYFFVIGWTSWEREEWLFENQYYQVNASGTNIVPTGLQQRYKDWICDSNLISQVTKSKSLHNEIFNLHKKLLESNIKHLFFNALMPFQHEVKSNPDTRSNWGINYIAPYDNDLSYYWYLKKQGFVPDGGNHYDTTAQECWADFLINYINQHKNDFIC
jgi:hypothetical protein